MQLEPSLARHPSRSRLVDFAETLVDRNAPVSAVLAAHVAQCSACAAEVRAIRASLQLTGMATLPEPSRELSQRILLQARQERQKLESARKRPALPKFVQIAACMMGITLLGTLSFSAALRDGADMRYAASAQDARPLSAPGASLAAKQPQSSVLQALAASMTLQRRAAFAAPESGYHRIIEFLDQDMNAALAALERNPGCPRANQMVDSGAEKRLEGLRSLFLDRTF